jgi:peptidoglycan/xylan/chitin deacetylase (PgdA/CDA1 family)
MSTRAKIVLAAIAVLLALVAYVKQHRSPSVYIFQGLEGPDQVTVVPPPVETPWKKYAGGGSSRLAVLLTDEHAPWLGLAHGLKSIGVPFVITDDYAEALRHRVILVFPMISGGVLSLEALRALATVPRNGGVLIGIDVLGGVQDVFGVDEARPSRQRFEVRFDPDAARRFGLIDPRELVLSLGNRDKTREAFGSYAYLGAEETALARFEDGQAAITERKVGTGRAYAFGIDLGALLLQAYNAREESAARNYVNEFEPTVDVLLRLVRQLYREGEPSAVLLGTVPDNRALSVIITHDIDYTRALTNSVKYAAYEQSQGIRATYFMQTKYVRDYNDEIMLSDATAPFLQQLGAMGMEVGSHTVAHSNAFKRMALGTGRERYPAYRPFVRDRETVAGATILGEVRVSQFLIERIGKYSPVVSFRPGYLSNPFALPQVLEALGFRYSSSVTADASLTHLPFRLNYGRENTAETGVFEFPVTVEDEERPPLGERLPQAIELARKIARYGGSFVLMIHPDILGQKFDFERGFVEAMKPQAWFGALEDFGSWWAARDAIDVDVEASGEAAVVKLYIPREIVGLSLSLPGGWRYRTSTPSGLDVSQQGSALVLARAQGVVTLGFTTAGH